MDKKGYQPINNGHVDMALDNNLHALSGIDCDDDN